MKIALISDTHLARIATAFTDNCVAALRWIEAAGVELIVHLGDVTADGVRQPEHFADARAIFDTCRVPIRFLPGNHDIGDNVLEGHVGHEPTVQPLGLLNFRDAFGPDRWALQAQGWTFVGLNAQLFGLADAEEAGQFAWLEQTLAALTGPVGLMLHKPLFRHGPGDTEVHPRYAPWAARSRLLELFAQTDLRFVASGHVHQWRRHAVDRVEHLWAPSSAFVMPDIMQAWIGEKAVGVVVMDLSREAHTFAFETPPGVERHDLADHPEVYPVLPSILAGLSAKAKT